MAPVVLVTVPWKSFSSVGHSSWTIFDSDQPRHLQLLHLWDVLNKALGDQNDAVILPFLSSVSHDVCNLSAHKKSMPF